MIFKMKANLAQITLYLLLVASVARADTIDHRAGVEAYAGWFLQNYPARFEQVKIDAIPAVLRYSDEYGVDPLLVACIISLESSWYPRPGALKEAGYMQVMRTKWSSQFDLTTTDGQIEAGVARLKVAFDKCGDVERAITHYGSGSCSARTERTRKKMQFRTGYYRRMVKRFRG